MTNREHTSYHARNPSPELRAKRRAAGRKRFADGYRIPPPAPFKLDITKEWLLEALAENKFSITLVARRYGRDFNTLKKYARHLGIDLAEMKRKNHVARDRHVFNHVITAIEPGPVVDVYDLSVDEIECFIANEICVHNCQRPNLMQVAKPKEFVKGEVTIEVPGLLDVFVPTPGSVIVGADVAKFQVHIAAVLMGDEALIHAIDTGADIHGLNARHMFGISEAAWKGLSKDKIDTVRRAAKYFLFGHVLFGGGLGTVWAQIVKDSPNVTMEMVKAGAELWYREHPKVRAWREKQLESARETDVVTNPVDGYVHRFFGDVMPTVAYNWPIQAAEASIMRAAMRRLDKRLDWEGTGLILMVHDALYLETPAGEVERTKAALVEEMTREVLLDGRPLVPTVDVGIGTRLGSLKKG